MNRDLVSASFGELTAKGHAFGGWNFHFIFTPAYRRRVFEVEGVKELCRKTASELARTLGFEIVQEFGPDHWHLFVSGAKNYSAPQLAQRLKGVTSLRVRSELGSQIKHLLWGDHLWSHGYFAETIGRVTSETVAHYIARSQHKHWLAPSEPTQRTLTNYAT